MIKLQVTVASQCSFSLLHLQETLHCSVHQDTRAVWLFFFFFVSRKTDRCLFLSGKEEQFQSLEQKTKLGKLLFRWTSLVSCICGLYKNNFVWFTVQNKPYLWCTEPWWSTVFILLGKKAFKKISSPCKTSLSLIFFLIGWPKQRNEF